MQDYKSLSYHYRILSDHRNKNLYQRIRLGMIKRGKAVIPFLLNKFNQETELPLQRDLLHILGRLRAPEALILARIEIHSADSDMRHRACYVIGWMGDRTDVAHLGEALLTDPDDYVRQTAATSHSQMWARINDLALPLPINMRAALSSEKSEEVAKWIIIATQYISGKQFGLREDIDESTIVGDVGISRSRCSRFLSTLV